ncbi:cytochrome b-c1 complex subunit 7 [Kalaharituber pfeilii]|nr:cytochrome b-c1 complex subunit 7 [Kalaharituber pfeilii]
MSLAPVRSLLRKVWSTPTGSAIREKYKDLAGYRKIGLVGDDLISEESDVVQQALKRLPPKVAYDRVYRMRRAMQCSLTQSQLPQHEQTKPEDDVPYLQPYIEEILREQRERQDLDALVRSK